MDFGSGSSTKSSQQVLEKDAFGDVQEDNAAMLKEEANDLATFREKWQRELKISSPTLGVQNVEKTVEDEDNESKAKKFFIEGIEMEKAGKMYEAIQCYRRAVQIVPDIEFKVDIASKPKSKEVLLENTEDDDIVKGTLETAGSDEDSDSEFDEEKFLLHVQKKIAKERSLCTPKREQNNIHIGQMPIEIVLYILRWVVSRDLDLRSLEMFSRVCRGFYLCARDPEIWHSACLRVWGLNCGSTPHMYRSWREMYIERPRLHYNGCYISKTTYIRPGENSFQDHVYRPWHLVAYYRLFRFFPEGVVHMLTTSEEPAQAVGLLKTRNPRYPVLSGYYRLKDDTATLVFQRQDKKKSFQTFKKGKRRETQENFEQTFHMELKIKNQNKKKHVQLVWAHYSIFRKSPKGDETTCDFDVRAHRFPPLWFSRVKSFTAESDTPLT